MIDLTIGEDQWFDAEPVVNLGMSDEIASKQGHKRPTVSLQEQSKSKVVWMRKKPQY